MVIYGINAVTEALRAGQVKLVRVEDPPRSRLRALVRMAEASGISVRRCSDAQLLRSSRGRLHQGVVADVDQPRAYTLEDLLQANSNPLLVVLDGIEDPQNLGAILRTAEAAGVDGVIRQSRRQHG